MPHKQRERERERERDGKRSRQRKGISACENDSCIRREIMKLNRISSSPALRILKISL